MVHSVAIDIAIVLPVAAGRQPTLISHVPGDVEAIRPLFQKLRTTETEQLRMKGLARPG